MGGVFNLEKRKKNNGEIKNNIFSIIFHTYIRKIFLENDMYKNLYYKKIKGEHYD